MLDDKAPWPEIIKANDDNVSRFCSEMLSYWLQTHPNATWYELVVALRASGVELNKVVASVEKTFHGMLE